MRYRLRTLLAIMTLLAIAAAVSGPAVARAVKEWTNPKPHLQEDEFRKLIEEWERLWYGNSPAKPPERTHGGVI